MNAELEQRWATATDVERRTFLEEAKRLLGNLVHYRNGGAHEADDLRLVAATLYRESREGVETGGDG